MRAILATLAVSAIAAVSPPGARAQPYPEPLPTVQALPGPPAPELDAPAQPASVRGSCDASGCRMLRVDDVRTVDESNLGRLLFVRARTWSERDGAETDVGGEDGYAFCSTMAPALVTVDGERVRVTWLAPQSPGELAKGRSAYVLYFQACHGAGQEAAADVAATADRLGYEVSRRSRATQAIGEPQEVLALAAATPGRPHPERVPSPRLYGWPGFVR